MSVLPEVRDVPDTAFMVAAYRALENARTAPLFRDPFASQLAGERGRQLLANTRRAEIGAWSVALRTVIIDAFLRDAIARGCDMVISLGAGLDARPYRMTLPAQLAWIEVDYARMIEYKRERLSGHTPRCALELIALDLADRPARQQLFARLATQAKQAIVLTEGVLPYLSNDDVASLADDLHGHGSFMHWIIDYFSPAMLRMRRRRGLQLKNAPFRFEPPDWFGFFAEHGFVREDIRYIPEVGRELQRPIPLPRVLSWIAQAMGRPQPQSFGYALLARRPTS